MSSATIMTHISEEPILSIALGLCLAAVSFVKKEAKS